MHTLPHQFEFLSDQWLDEAKSFLAARLGTSDELGPFRVSEQFADAPPHLEFEGNVAAWTLNYDGESLTVGRDVTPDADVFIEGDYQAALTAAQIVGAQIPGAMADELREVTHTFGEDAIRPRDRLQNPEARSLLAVLHDHMARRTVDNPDLAHRAARQGLTRHVQEMEKNGYTVIERAISPEFADEVRAATVRALVAAPESQGTAMRSMQWMLYHGREFERIVLNPALLTLVDASLGRGAVIGSISSIKRGPGPGMIPMHTDYSQVPQPYPEFALTGVGVWALEDWTVASGPTWLVPGSHKQRRPPGKDEHAEGVPIEMSKGSVVYFTHGVWHWQGDRSEPGERVTLHCHFNRGILRSLEPKTVDVQMLHRNPPRLGEILGEDDWFDKLTEAGRDHLRMMHMHELNSFNDVQKQAILAEATGH